MAISIGYAQEIITPPLNRPVYLAGFGRNRRAESVHDDLTVRAIALQNQQNRLALVAVDLIGLGRKIYRRCQNKLAKAIPGIQLILTCTHTHHGPDTLGLWGPEETIRGVDPTYMSFMEKQIIRAVKQAFQYLSPAHLRASSVHVPGIVKNARNPEILDQELTSVQFVDPDSDQVHLTLLNFPCHPETLWESNLEITADYPYYLRQQVECLTQANCLFVSGALGGMMTPDVSEHSFSEAEQIGILLAQAAVDSLSRQAPLPLEHFDYGKLEFSIPLKSPLLEQAMSLALVQDSDVKPGLVLTEAGLLRLGPVWFAHVPGELLPKLGLQMKNQMRAAGASVCGILGLANDEIGYILPDEDYLYPVNPFDPGDHYEETMSISPSAGSQLSAAIQSMLLNNTH